MEPPQEGASRTIDLEREDLAAALSHVQESHEIALVDTLKLPGDVIEYHLISVTDDPVTIRIVLPPADERDVVPAAVTVRYGRFRDTKREEAILNDLRSRLRWLAARD